MLRAERHAIVRVTAAGQQVDVADPAELTRGPVPMYVYPPHPNLLPPGEKG